MHNSVCGYVLLFSVFYALHSHSIRVLWNKTHTHTHTQAGLLGKIDFLPKKKVNKIKNKKQKTEKKEQQYRLYNKKQN